MTYSRHKPCLCLLGVAVLAAMALVGCAESSPRPPPAPPPPPPPFVAQEVPVELGDHGGSITLMTTQSGGYTKDGQPFQSGATIEASGNQYKLTLADGKWSAEYVPPEPMAVALGTSGEALLIVREEDGSYQAGDITFQSGEVLPPASNGNVYRLTFKDEEWDVEYVAPDPVPVQLGTSGESLSLTRQEDRTYKTDDGELIENGEVWNLAANGSDYELTFVDGEWSAEYVPPAPSTVTLGETRERLLVTRREDGRYEANGELLVSERPVAAKNGNMYRLTLANNEWTAEFVPQSFTVKLGGSGETINLVKEEGGQYWLGRMVIEDGHIHPTRDGDSYRLTLRDGEWTAEYVPEVVQVQAGESGTFIVLLRLEGDTYILDGHEVQSGDRVERNGNEYVLTRSGNKWTAEFKSGTVDVDLPGGGSVALTKREDGSYTLGGRVVRSGSTRTINGVRYRLTLGSDGWTATRRRVFPTSPGGSGTTGGGSTSSRTETDEHDEIVFRNENFRLCDDCSSALSTSKEGTHLEVGTAARVEYSLYELLGRSGIVSEERTFVESAKEEIQGILDTIKSFASLYEIDAIDPNEHINTGRGTEVGLWTQAMRALMKIFGEDFSRSKTLEREYRRLARSMT